MAIGSRAGVLDAAGVVVLILVHFTFHRFIAHWAVAPNFLVGGLLLAALRLRSGHAALLGFALGVLEAAMGLEGFGTISLVLTIVGYLAARSRDLLFADARYYTAIYLFVGTWVAELGLLLAMGGGKDFLLALVLTPVSAAATALVCSAVEAATSAARQY
jgi:cell shape-determining protein MreD